MESAQLWETRPYERQSARRHRRRSADTYPRLAYPSLLRVRRASCRMLGFIAVRCPNGTGECSRPTPWPPVAGRRGPASGDRCPRWCARVRRWRRRRPRPARASCTRTSCRCCRSGSHRAAERFAAERLPCTVLDVGAGAARHRGRSRWPLEMKAPSASRGIGSPSGGAPLAERVVQGPSTVHPLG